MPHTFTYLDREIVAPTISDVISHFDSLLKEYGDLPVIFVDEWEGLRGLDFDNDISYSSEDDIGQVFHMPERIEVG